MKQGASGGTKSLFGGRKDLIEDKTTDPLFMKEGGQYYFYHNDHLGTPQKLTSVNGAVVWHATCSSFGEAAIEVETVENNLRFPGQYFDSETGLHYNWHRYYDPRIGRYLRADQIWSGGGINLFSYCVNDPVNWFDPDGLAPRRHRFLDPPGRGGWGGGGGGFGGGGGRWKPPRYPSNPNKPPGKDWEWRGPRDKGSWHKKDPRQSLRPDLENKKHGPHYDWKDPDKQWWRIYPDGSCEPK